MNFNLSPVLSSLITGELARARRISTLDPLFLELTPQTEIGRGDLGTDSLDLLNLAAAVTEMFHLFETGDTDDLLRYRTVASWSEIVETSLRRKAERITFRSSGSTGTPKRCVHTLEHLAQESREHAAGLSHCRRILSMIPSHHIYGFIWTVLVPAELHVPMLDIRRWPLSRLSQELRSGDVLVGVPANWAALFNRNLDSIPRNCSGVTSGARCPDEVFQQAQERMQFLEVYGSSETAGIATRKNRHDPFQLLSFWERQDPKLLRRTGIEDPELNLVQVPDELTWVSGRAFHIGSRTDGAVQVNGINVYPQRVADLIRTHPDVQDCSVRPLVPNEDSRLKAFIVWRSEGRKYSEQSLQLWLKNKLQPCEVPAKLTFGPSLPVNEMGKIVDWTTT